MLKFYCYEKCTTCKKAKKFLEEHDVSFESFEIKENHFNANDMKNMHEKSGKTLKQVFNTSGNLYKEHNLKDKLASMSNEEAYELLASSGMLVKRPVLISEDQVLFGFKPAEYEEVISHVKRG